MKQICNHILGYIYRHDEGVYLVESDSPKEDKDDMAIVFNFCSLCGKPITGDDLKEKDSEA